MRILIALTYYRPHTSGLTIYTERIANALARLGHEVTILTSRFSRDLPREEKVGGIRVVRAPVWFKVSKGVIMPTIGFIAWKLVIESDALILHLPQFDAAGIATRGRILRKPTILTYHCDLRLPLGIFNGVANFIVNRMNQLAAILSDLVVTNTKDYADNSPFLSRFQRKVKIIPPPIELAPFQRKNLDHLRNTLNPSNDYPVIGMVSRFAAEKGIEVLLQSLPMILKQYPRAKVLFVGPFREVIGERKYCRRLAPRIHEFTEQQRWMFVGMLDPELLSAFYRLISVLVVPSLNSTESFGLVQIEAMIHGTPVVASDLPGIRIPIKDTGMGKLFDPGDSLGLARSVIDVLTGDHAKAEPEELKRKYSPDAVAAEYERLCHTLLKAKKHRR